MAFLFFILCFFLTKPVFAAPTVEITVAPSSLSSVGSSFPVQFIITNADANSNFYYKFCGGIGSSTTQIQTTPSLSCGSDWVNFSTVNIDAGGSAAINSTAYIKPNVSSGTYNFFTRIALIPKGNSWSTYDSSITTISVTAPTLVPTATPTSDPTVTNPSSGVSLTEFMPYSDPEWIELYNSNEYPVKLVSWKLEDKDANTRNISSLLIPAKSYLVFEYSPFFDNNNSETIILRNQSNVVISQTSYSAGLRTLDRSWSLINNNWCQSSITKGYENVTSCYSAPTSTPTKTPTPTPTDDQGKFTASDVATESAIIEPVDISNTTASSVSEPTITPTGVILGDDITNTTKKNYLPLILIISGGLLLTSPLIISKFKK